MMASQKFLAVGAGVLAAAAGFALIAEALLWANVRAAEGAGPAGFYLLAPPGVAVSVADGGPARTRAAEEAWPREPARR